MEDKMETKILEPVTGTTFEEKASSLTNGGGGKYIETYGGRFVI